MAVLIGTITWSSWFEPVDDDDEPTEFEHADHRHGHAVDVDRLPDRVDAVEQLGGRVDPSTATAVWSATS